MPPRSRVIRSAPRSGRASSSRSQAKMTCRPCRSTASSVCCSSRRVAFLPTKNCRSSMTSTSAVRQVRRNPGRPPPWSDWRKAVVNCSADRTTAVMPGCNSRARSQAASSRCVFPTPLGPWITRGDISPGRAAASSTPANAIRLLGPTTKSLSRRGCRRDGATDDAPGRETTRNCRLAAAGAGVTATSRARLPPFARWAGGSRRPSGRPCSWPASASGAPAGSTGTATACDRQCVSVPAPHICWTAASKSPRNVRRSHSCVNPLPAASTT